MYGRRVHVPKQASTIEESSPPESDTTILPKRAARERSERVKAAQTALAEIKQQRQEREEKRPNGKKPREPRASTTDADARVMKMADGGFRPGYNVQVTSAAGEQIVVGLDVTNTGSDRGLMRPIAQRLADLGALRDGLDLKQAVDVFWFYFGYSGLLTLHNDNGWSYERAEQWLCEEASRALLQSELVPCSSPQK